MFDKEAINALQEGEAITAAREALANALATSAVVALPDDFTTHDLEGCLDNRRRERGAMNTSQLDSFVRYTNEHSEEGATVFIDADNFKATAVLNLGTPLMAGHADNLSVLSLMRTAAYDSLINHTQSSMNQSTIAEFFEDFTEHLKFYNDDGQISNAKAVAAVRKVTIDEVRKLESTETQLSSSKSAFEKISASSTETLPTTVYFECQPYHGLFVRTFVLRLSVVSNGDKTQIRLRIAKLEVHKEEMAVELSDLIKNNFILSVTSNQPTIVLGTYQKR